MLDSSIAFAFTDIYIKRSLVFIDSFNFMIIYNIIVGAGSLALLPYLGHRRVPVMLVQRDLGLCFC